jgi:hypothetical protein
MRARAESSRTDAISSPRVTEKVARMAFDPADTQEF